jgi:hypothetical protein
MNEVQAYLDKAKSRLKEHQQIRRTKVHSDLYELALEACSDAIEELQKKGVSNRKLKSYKADIDKKGTCRTPAQTIIKSIEEYL